MKKHEEPIDRMLRWAADRGWNQTELARRLGLESSALITNWKNRERRLPPDYYQPVADLFGRSVDELVGRAPERATSSAWLIQQVPVRGAIQLGRQGHWDTADYPLSGDGYIDMPSRDKDAYALRILGDGLHPRVRSGEYVVISPNEKPIPTRDALVVTRDGRSFIAEFLYARDGQHVLQSVDPTHMRLTFQDAEIERICLVSGIEWDATFLPGSDLAQPGMKLP